MTPINGSVKMSPCEKGDDFIESEGASGVWAQPMVTEVRPFAQFYPAEEYHHQYYRQNPEQGYCQVVIAPKLKEP
jgi:peptide methionine sulfoxide reductase MsrA